MLKMRWMAFHRLVLAWQCEALSFHGPHADGRVFLNTGVMASHGACKAYGRGRWWLISGICSNSDSWCPTSPPLIRAACSVMDIAQPLSEGEGITVEMIHSLKRASPKTQLLQFARGNCYHFRGVKNKHALKRHNCAPSIRCALIPELRHQQVCPAAQQT